MAGPMVGPLLDGFPIEQVRDLLGARRRVPRPRAQPAARGEPRASSSTSVRAERRRARHRVGRRRRPLLLHRRHGPSSSTATSSRRCSPSRSCARSRAPRSSTTCAPRAPCPTSSSAAGGTALVNRVGHAFFKTRMREEGAAFGGEVSGHYYFRDFYCADSGHDPRAADPRAAVASRARSSAELLAPLRSRYFISGEINSEVAGPGRRR